MNFMKINSCDVINSINGIAVSLWVSGCPHKCKGCFNPSTWDINSGRRFEDSDLERILSYMSSSHIDVFSVLGGEPLAPYNIDKVLSICEAVKSSFPEKTIMIWTGYDEDIIKKMGAKKAFVDYVIVGKFVEELKDTHNLLLRGSSNQKIIDIKTGNIVTDDYIREIRKLEV